MRKVTTKFIAIFLFLVGHNTAYGWVYKANILEIGYSFNSYDYSEKLEAPFKSDESGMVPGIIAKYHHRWPGNLYFMISAEISKGRTDYDGSRQDGTPAVAKTDNSFHRYELCLGYTLWPTNTTTISPYAGIGTGMWKRELDDGTASEYRERYSLNYIPLGIIFVFEPTPWIAASLDIAYHHTFGSQIRIDGITCKSISGDLGNEPGLYVEGPVTIRLRDSFVVRLVPFLYLRKFGESDILEIIDRESGHGVMEPSSRSKTTGVSIRIGYLF